MKILPLTLLATTLSWGATAQEAADHDTHLHELHMREAGDMMEHMPATTTMTAPSLTVQEGGQSAFAAIQEIVAVLMADPGTDWDKVDLETLRQHLIDMDNVTLRSNVVSEEIDGGARFDVTSSDPSVTASIRRMLSAHVATMDGEEGWSMRADDIASGARLTITGNDSARIRGLGFIGLLTVGMHHQTHHLALASGVTPHGH